MGTFWILVCILAAVPAFVYLFWTVHRMLNRICMWHARKFCRRSGLRVRRMRCQPAFEDSGTKTEYTLVLVDCENGEQERRLVLLLTWPFGVKAVLSDEVYTDSFEEYWSPHR